MNPNEPKTFNYSYLIIMILSVCLGASIAMSILIYDHGKREVAKTRTEYSEVLKQVVTKEDMLKVALGNVYRSNLDSYTPAMQNLIISALDGKKSDFRIYLHIIQEDKGKIIKP